MPIRTTHRAGVSRLASLASRAASALLLVDVAAVVAFVALGRAEHDDDGASSSAVEVVAPFLIALVLGWLATRAWRHPLARRTGIGVWIVTLVAGLVLRRVVFDDGTALAFVIVATLFLGLTLIGWRWLLSAMSRADETT